MITLITGVPGTGKTALAVSMVMVEPPDRQLICDGVKDLTLVHVPLPVVNEWTKTVEDPASPSGVRNIFAFEPGSLVVIDEAQRIFRPRPAGAPVPAYVQAFETHRQEGLDFWLITQHPNLIDANIRKLVGRHIHLRAGLLGRQLCEWSEVGDVESSSARSLSAKRKYKLPSHVFTRYKSAEVHTKVKRRVPFYAYLAVFAVVSLVISVGMVYRTLSRKLSPPVEEASVTKGASAAVAGASAAAPAAPPMTYLEAQVERVPGLAHTAPVFDGLTVAKSAPFPSACVASAARCACFTEQATPLEMGEALCRQIVATGLYKPWHDAKALQVAQAAPMPPARSTANVEPNNSRAPSGASNDGAVFGGSHIRTGGVTGSVASPVGPAPVAPVASYAKPIGRP